MRLQIHVHVHVRVLDRADRLDVIQPKALGHLAKVRSGHRVQEPRNDLLDGPGLLLRQFVDHGRLGDALDIDIVGSLPRTEIGGRGARDVDWFVRMIISGS